MAYQPIPTKTEGGQKKAVTSDDSVEELLWAILTEIKMMNVHLSVITELENEDVD